jgi:hypothetical protein
MPEKEPLKKKVLAQDPAHGAHLRLPTEADLLAKHAAYFDGLGDKVEAANYLQREKHTRARHVHALKAAAFVETLGLGHEVKTEGYTFNDAVNFVAKAMHEHEQHESGTHTIAPLYVRGHAAVKDVNEATHVDLEKFNAPRDSAGEVIDALGLTDPAQIEAAKALFVGKAV